MIGYKLESGSGLGLSGLTRVGKAGEGGVDGAQCRQVGQQPSPEK